MNASSRRIYENLVFEGGGVKGSAYAGCVQVLAEHNLLYGVKRVAGTSAGSITATLLAVGSGSDGLTESILNTDFEQFVSDPWGIVGDISRLARHYGLHSGDGFVEAIQGYITKYTGNPDLTFADLEELIREEPETYKHLSVVASNITTQQPTIFDSKSTPDVPIWQAVRCSMSIPILFEPFVLNDEYFMDGGLGWVYPIDMYDRKKPNGTRERNPETLGFFLEPQSHMNRPNFQPPRVDVDSFKAAVEAMADLMSNTANSKHIHHGDISRTVFVDDLGINATDFSISEKEKKRLIQSGREATEKFLANVS